MSKQGILNILSSNHTARRHLIVCDLSHPISFRGDTCMKNLEGRPHMGDNRVFYGTMVTSTHPKWFNEVQYMLESIDRQCIQANFYTYSRLLQGCSDMKALAEGKMVHAYIETHGGKLDRFLGTTLVDTYIKCGSIEDACQVFDKIYEPDLLACNIMLAAHVNASSSEKAFELFGQMEWKGIKPNEVTFVALLKVSSNMGDLEKARLIHAFIIKNPIKPNIFMENSLIDMYVKCGSIQDACEVFDNMSTRDVVSWNTMIGGWAKHVDTEKAFSLFMQMRHEGLKQNEVTFLILIHASGSLGDLDHAKRIHAQLSEVGVKQNPSVRNALVDMYCKCGSIIDARKVFDSMAKRDVVSWNTMIAGYAKNSHADEVLELFQYMRQRGFKPDKVTFLSILNACAKLGNLKGGKEAHACLLETGIEPDILICSALVDMYAKCRDLEDARRQFEISYKQNVVLWTVMIDGYGKHGNVEEAVILFHLMTLEGIKPNDVTFLSILSACAIAGNLEEGWQMHVCMLEVGMKPHLLIDNALVNMYSKCGHIEDAFQVFDSMTERDIVSWTAMIEGYAIHGHYDNVLLLFKKMDVQPDKVTFVSVINVCANLAALEQGMLIHSDIIKCGFFSDVFVENALIDMYAKCGSLKEAHRVLDETSKRDIVSWNTMITGSAQHGQGKDTLKLITSMQMEGVRLNDISFVGVLSACSHSGLLYEACHYFDSMLQEHGIAPRMEHYACMVDLLGRAGHLKDAEEFIQKMPIQPCATVWGTLLAACRIHRNADLAKCAAEHVLQLEPKNTAAFVLASNIIAATRMPVTIMRDN